MSKQNKKFQIEAFKHKVVMDPKYPDKTWKILEDAIHEIYNHNASGLSFEELYRNCTNTHLNEGNNHLVSDKALPMGAWVLFQRRFFVPNRDHLESRMTAKYAGRGTKVGGVMQRQICWGCEKHARKEVLEKFSRGAKVGLAISDSEHSFHMEGYYHAELCAHSDYQDPFQHHGHSS
ncbi:hypothetical protein TSUD_370840 [Trifolium subterraneum]|uniref:Cullin N-terminal domain-containing protein n=1 Tax=Trifolium subterraneum TaxID=3900 RepID=A0A2Z6PUR0_TRISU|nr:hypothetical protein TSUD_370840 [Trifolium subterraneum]